MATPRQPPHLLGRALAAAGACALVAASALATELPGRPPARMPGPPHSGTITGVVLRTGSPAVAHVCLEAGRPCVLSDAQGRFRMDGVAPGRRTIVVFAPDLEITQLAVDVPEVNRRPLRVRIDCPRLECDYAGRPPAGPGCLRVSSEERARIGTVCPLHPWVRLLADTVGVEHGGGSVGALPGQSEAERDSFPNARVFRDRARTGGKAMYAEIAYCPECRRAYERWRARNHDLH